MCCLMVLEGEYTWYLYSLPHSPLSSSRVTVVVAFRNKVGLKPREFVFVILGPTGGFRVWWFSKLKGS